MNKKFSVKDVINTAKRFRGDTLRSLEHYLCDLLDVSPDRFTLRWDSPLSSIGSYLGTGDDIKESSGYMGNKRIAYTDTEGNAAYADPYKPGKIVIKPGTEVRLQMVAGSSDYDSSCVFWGDSARGNDWGVDYCLLSASWTPSGSYTLTMYDDYHNNNDSEGYIYRWYVEAS